MSIVRYVDPPDPPEGESWCQMCLMLAKNKIIQDHKDAIEQAAKDGHGRDRELWVPWDDTIKLFPAKYRAISDMGIQIGFLNLCWTHVAGIQIQQMSTLARPDGGLPPGLIRGQG